MLTEDIDRLRSYTDKVVAMRTSDGEELTVKILLMQDEYQDFICDILASNRQQKYSKPLNSAAYTIRYDDIAFFALAPASDPALASSANGAASYQPRAKP
jgi:hypothetical protein